MSSIVEQVGRVIGGRYRLLAVVGAGASAQVFAADDTRLSRRVAVKLLHPALAGDATFLRKFQAEARLAASLNHRNVLHVYDWGDEDGVPYLVLEYLGGGSLRSLLDTGYLLSPQQAASIGAEAANGLAYAHRRGLVHRDIKPANLLFDDDGRLLVADFGLARALAEAAITEPLGAVMGTARYASPEQVEGRPVDDRTDVYSLALTLYESVTGRVPFAGDTTVATLMARVGAVLPPARELGSLAPILAQAAISEPLARLDAGALAYELELLLLELDAPAPIPLARLYVSMPNLPRGTDRDPTERLGPAAPQDEVLSPIEIAPIGTPVVEPSANGVEVTELIEAEPTFVEPTVKEPAGEVITPSVIEPADEVIAPPPPPLSDWQSAPYDLDLIEFDEGEDSAEALAAAAIASPTTPPSDAVAQFTEAAPSPPARLETAPSAQTPPAQTPPVQTPPVQTPAIQTPPVQTPAIQTPPVQTPAVQTPTVQTPAVQAPTVQTPTVQPPIASPQEVSVAAPAVRPETAPLAASSSGERQVTTVISAEPARKIRRHRWLPWLLIVLALELAAGGVIITRHQVVHRDTVPPITGLQAGAARATIVRMGLYPELTGELYSPTVVAGQVITQSPPAGKREKAGSIVKMVISLGRHPTSVPTLSGLSGTAARAAIVAAHLVPHFTRQFSEIVPVGRVITWAAVSTGRAYYGDPVDVVVSKGPMPQVIPIDLKGGVSTWTQAQAALTDLHLLAAQNPRYSTTVPAGYVVTTEPPPGTTVPGHSKVLVFVSQGPPYVVVPPVDGKSAALAEKTLTGLGFKWALYGPAGAGTVLTTLPRVGQSVRYGETIEIYLY